MTRRHADLVLQALAAIGQGDLISMWSEVFAEKNITVAQVLLTHDDISTVSVDIRHVGCV